MARSAQTAVSVVLPALILCSAACDVYDSSLSRHLEGRKRRLADAGESVPDASASEPADDAGEESDQERCGNSVVDRGERCDVAIAVGKGGACPEGCSGREGCVQRVLVGTQCSARCMEVRITRAIPDDGCCPSEATAVQDNDCASSCGNGVVERGERCDPPETCATKDDCVSAEPCQHAKYVGDPKQCTAACELSPIQACVAGDKCCPAGCNGEKDGDCRNAASSCDGGCVTPAGQGGTTPNDAGIDCQTDAETECAACECTECADELSACLKTPGDGNAEKCEALSRCSAAAECTGTDCYCGQLSTERCNRAPAGRCTDEIQAISGRRTVAELITIASTTDGALARWARLDECRASKCRRACSL
jgi:hypothetical protein